MTLLLRIQQHHFSNYQTYANVSNNALIFRTVGRSHTESELCLHVNLNMSELTAQLVHCNRTESSKLRCFLRTNMVTLRDFQIPLKSDSSEL